MEVIEARYSRDPRRFYGALLPFVARHNPREKGKPPSSVSVWNPCGCLQDRLGSHIERVS